MSNHLSHLSTYYFENGMDNNCDLLCKNGCKHHSNDILQCAHTGSLFTDV